MKKTWVCIGSGPSLTDEQVDHVVWMRQSDPSIGILVVNDNYKKVPSADVIFAADRHWWLDNFYQIHDIGQMMFVLDEHNPFKHRLVGIKSTKNLDEVGDNVFYHGGNSGQIAVHLVDALFNPDEIFLIGYDYQHTGGKAHWFGDHPKKYKANAKVDRWVDAMTNCMKFIKADVVNCSIETAIPESVIRRGNIFELLN